MQFTRLSLVSAFAVVAYAEKYALYVNTLPDETPGTKIPVTGRATELGFTLSYDENERLSATQFDMKDKVLTTPGSFGEDLSVGIIKAETAFWGYGSRLEPFAFDVKEGGVLTNGPNYACTINGTTLRYLGSEPYDGCTRISLYLEAVDEASTTVAPSPKTTSILDTPFNRVARQAPQWNGTVTRSTTAVSTVCSKCEAGESSEEVTLWRTLTNYVTFCPTETTFTINKCDKVCEPSTVVVSTPTTLTFPGVCIFPETTVVPQPLRSDAPRQGSQQGDAPRQGSQQGDAPRQGNQQGDAPRQGNQQGGAPRPANQQAGSPRTSSNSAARPTRVSNTASTRPGAQNLTDGTAPSISSFNGASKNAMGAFAIGFAALLL